MKSMQKLWDFKHIREDLSFHYDISTFILKSMVIPICIAMLLFGFILGTPLLGILTLSILLYFLFSLLPDFVLVVGILSGKAELIRFSHSIIGYVCYIGLIFFIFIQLIDFISVLILLFFAVFGLTTHLFVDNVEESSECVKQSVDFFENLIKGYFNSFKSDSQ